MLFRSPDWDPELTAIADYVCDADITSDVAFETAHYCLMEIGRASCRERV